MTVYSLSINNGTLEFYSLSSFRNAFKKNKLLFEFLEREGEMLYVKQNDKSMIWGTVKPLENGEVKFIIDSKHISWDGAYGN